MNSIRKESHYIPESNHHDSPLNSGEVPIPGMCNPLIPSGYVKIAIENGPVEIVDLPIETGDFP